MGRQPSVKPADGATSRSASKGVGATIRKPKSVAPKQAAATLPRIASRASDLSSLAATGGAHADVKLVRSTSESSHNLLGIAQDLFGGVPLARSAASELAITFDIGVQL
jgi:hypothetical protein